MEWFELEETWKPISIHSLPRADICFHSILNQWWQRAFGIPDYEDVSEIQGVSLVNRDCLGIPRIITFFFQASISTGSWINRCANLLSAPLLSLRLSLWEPEYTVTLSKCFLLSLTRKKENHTGGTGFSFIREEFTISICDGSNQSCGVTHWKCFGARWKESC